MTKDTFSTFHPVVNFIYFLGIIGFSMFLLHPVIIGISLLIGFCYSVILNGKKAFFFNLSSVIPMIIIMSILNPIINHEGVTILSYMKDGNPITLESILYGVLAAMMFASVIIWFSCYNAIMTSDKFIYLFGKLIPSLSLILSMVLRMVPRYKQQIRKISEAQKYIGLDVKKGNWIQRLKKSAKVISILVTWALENAIETSDSMKARGYGLAGRTSFSIFKIDKRDKVCIYIMIFFLINIFIGISKGECNLRIFPSIKGNEITLFSIYTYISYLGFATIPIISNILEERKWKYIESKI